MTDYPAAHSMDSCWFAVDLDGNVAMFDTGEGGALPVFASFPLGGEAGGGEEFEGGQLLAAALLARAKTDAALAELLPDDEDTLRTVAEAGYWEMDLDGPRLLRSLGVWFYECDEGMAFPYVRQGTAVGPVVVGDLPADIAARFLDAKLPVRFAEEAELQPGEYGPVEAWGDAWVDRDGKAHVTESGDPKAVAGLDVEEHRWSPPEGRDVEPAPEGDDLLGLVRELLELGRQELERDATATHRAAAARAASDADVDWPEKRGFVGWLKKLFGG